MRSRLTLIGVVIPVLGVALLTARAELAVRTGPQFQIPIRGYDPRDMLRGQYLQYQYEFRWEATATCPPEPMARREPGPVPGCCLCFDSTGDVTVDPATRQVSCEEVEGCGGWVHAETMMPPQRHFIPEDRARELEDALRDREASIRLRTNDRGQPAVDALLLDGVPWRQILD